MNTDTPVDTCINGRWHLLLPAHRALRPEWTSEAGWERQRLDAMHKVIANQGAPVVYDIGAEEGDLPALWCLWGAQVVLVEPNPRVWPNIRFIFEANYFLPRVLAWHVGFAGAEPDPVRPEWVARYVEPVTQGWPSCAFGPVIGDHGFLVLPERPDCPVQTVDELARTTKPPTVITIDVEGAELTVLRGAAMTIATHKPVVFVSIHIDMPWIDEKYPGDTGDQVIEFMFQLGYVGYHLATDHEEHWMFQPLVIA